MKLNLDVLKTEILEYLQTRQLVTFYGLSRTLDQLPIVMWDESTHPDYKEFIQAAEAAGAKMIIFHARQFSADFIDRALDDLEGAGVEIDERRALERRLRELRAYDGFTCSVELSFDSAHRAYLYELRTDWYEEFTDILEDIDTLTSVDDEDEDEGPIGGYFSKN